MVMVWSFSFELMQRVIILAARARAPPSQAAQVAGVDRILVARALSLGADPLVRVEELDHEELLELTPKAARKLTNRSGSWPRADRA
jgi:hypothetical protein